MNDYSEKMLQIEAEGETIIKEIYEIRQTMKNPETDLFDAEMKLRKKYLEHKKAINKLYRQAKKENRKV